MEHNEQGFSYTYSAGRREEVEAIRQKYLPPQEDKMELLRALDRKPGRAATGLSLTVGVLSVLIMGTGMSLCLVWGNTLMLPGIAVGVLGMAGMAVAYPLYRHVLRRERERIAPEVLRLAEELTRE